MQLIWLALWFWLASFQQKTQWVQHYFVQAKHQIACISMLKHTSAFKSVKYWPIIDSIMHKVENLLFLCSLLIHWTTSHTLVAAFLSFVYSLALPSSFHCGKPWCLYHVYACPTVDTVQSIESWFVAAHPLCRKELIKKLHNFVHLNLCIALALGLFLFLTGIQTATGNIVRLTSNKINCKQVHQHYCAHHPPLYVHLYIYCRVLASLLHSYCTTSSWPPSPGRSVKQSWFTIFWRQHLEPMTESGSTCT